MSTCRNCQIATPFHGWDECLACGVSIALHEDPDYIHTARRLFSDDTEWLAELEAEWARQSAALDVTPIRMTIRQAS